MVKALIITGFGINCQEEMVAAYELAGASAEQIHLQQLLLGNVSIHDYDILNLAGGFSFGDDLGAGKVLANKIQFQRLPSGKTLLQEITTFIAEGKHILGICNGFQVLVRLGLLPNTQLDGQQEVSLMTNDSTRFEARWVHCTVEQNHQSPFLKGITKIELPVRHAEGKLVIAKAEIQAQIIKDKLNVMSYSSSEGNSTNKYPENPNGAMLNCAALTDTTGQILGMMPHPEAFLSLYNHPNWRQLLRQNPDRSKVGEGLQIFKNIVDYLSDK